MIRSLVSNSGTECRHRASKLASVTCLKRVSFPGVALKWDFPEVASHAQFDPASVPGHKSNVEIDERAL